MTARVETKLELWAAECCGRLVGYRLQCIIERMKASHTEYELYCFNWYNVPTYTVFQLWHCGCGLWPAMLWLALRYPVPSSRFEVRGSRFELLCDV